jgi:hypothetical protein
MTCIRASLPVVSVVLGVFFLVAGCSGPTAPTSYETFNAKDGTVQCKAPAGWDRQGGGGKKFLSCSFLSGGAKIRVMADVGGSALGDIAKSGGGLGMAGDMLGTDELDEELTAEAQVHHVTLDQASEDLGEIDVKSTETVTSGFGPTRVSEFTCAAALGSKTHGMIATALAMNHRIRVICTCNERHWETLKPAFEEVIASVARGQAE